MQFLIFSVAGQSCAIKLSAVERIEMAATLLPIPGTKATAMKCGMINIRGKIIPVASLEELLGSPKREIELNDHFIICNFNSESMALWVGGIDGVEEIDESLILSSESFMSGCIGVDQVIKDANRIIIIWDFEGKPEEVCGVHHAP